MNFVLRGQSFAIDHEDVKKAIRSLQPESVTKYAVEIGSLEYPIKQVVAKITGSPPVGFTSQDAYRILKKLGFKINIKN